MQIFRFTSLLRISGILPLAFALTHTVEATFTSVPVGCFPIELTAGRDTSVGLPLVRSAVFTGRLASVVGSEITLDCNPGWSPDSLAAAGPNGEYHYCIVLSGDLVGARLPILANGENSMIVSDEGEDLSALMDSNGLGVRVRILPYWTPASAFAHSQVPEGTQLVLFDLDDAGAVTGPGSLLTFSTVSGWTDEVGHSADTRPLRDGRGFFVRLPESADSAMLQVVGVVPMTTERHVFIGSLRQAGSAICFALNRPEAIDLVAAGLEFADRTRVFAYDGPRNSVWEPSDVYTYYAGYGWFDERYQPVAKNTLLAPGRAYFVRIPQVREDTEWVWSRRPSYAF